MIKKRKKSVFNFDNILRIISGRIPFQVIIQFTDRCNATCPQCGMRATEKYKRSEFNTETLKKIIDNLAKQKIKVLSFTGGEPFLLFNRLAEMIEYAGNKGIPYTRTGTNGFFFQGSDKSDFSQRISRIAEKLADTKLHSMWISLDSCDIKIHEKMRGLPGVIKGIKKGLPIFHKNGIYPSANLGINRNTGGFCEELYNYSGDNFNEDWLYDHFCNAFRRFYKFVIDLGFTAVNCCYPMSIDKYNMDKLDAVYKASANDRVIKFTNKEKLIIFKALFDIIPEFRHKIRIITPRVAIYALIKQYLFLNKNVYPCRGGIDFFYINCNDKYVYPCGYRGNEKLGSAEDINLKKIKSEPFCLKCDWECFRDPTQLMSPFLDLFKNPWRSIKEFYENPYYFKIWLKDINYYKTIDYINLRIPPDYSKMHKFKLSPIKAFDNQITETI